MKLVIYTADCCGNAANCEYPNRVEVTSAAELAEAVGLDHVAAKYENYHRGIDNFEEADAIEMDCDNDHSDDPADWITPEKLAEDPDLGDVDFAATPSRHNMLPKGNKSPRPRFHIHFPIGKCTNPEEIAAMKRALQKKYPFFDDNALDAGRFMFGTPVKEDEVFWHEGFLTVDEILTDAEDEDDSLMPPTDGTILEGSRNNTMSHFAGRVLKRYGVCDKERGYDWGGLYDKMRRVSCWCCPLQSLTELRVLYRDFPDLWAQLKRWDAMTWRSFKSDYTVLQLEQRFDFEEEWLNAGNYLGTKAFYSALRERLVELDGTHDTDPRQPV